MLGVFDGNSLSLGVVPIVPETESAGVRPAYKRRNIHQKVQTMRASIDDSEYIGLG